MRRAGYGFWSAGKKSNGESFARRLSAGDYPRFHIYAKKEGNDLILNLHLDQKKPSYSGSRAHSGEYEDSEVLTKEAEKIKNILQV